MSKITRIDIGAGMNHLTFPSGSALISVDCVREVVRLWVGIPTGPGGAAESSFRVDLVSTGENIPKDAGRHLGTFVWGGGEWHAFEVNPS